jgi:hypothetical protein
MKDKKPDIKGIIASKVPDRAIEGAIQTRLQQLDWSGDFSNFTVATAAIEAASTPTEISKVLEEAAKAEAILGYVYNEILLAAESGANLGVSSKRAGTSKTLNSLELDLQTELDRLHAWYNDPFGGMGVIGAEIRYDQQSSKIAERKRSARSDLELFESQMAGHIEDVKLLASEHMLMPRVVRLRHLHSKGIYQEFERVALNHEISLEAASAYLLERAPEAHASLMALLKGNYTVEDLANLASFGATAKITESPEQRTLLQFINHSLLPSADYFEIWASKMSDLQKLESEVADAIWNKDLKDRPLLEVMGEKPVSLSGRRDVGKLAVDRKPQTPAERNAHAREKERHAEAASMARQILDELHDPSSGTLKERHHRVKTMALESIREFNAFFAGIEGSLKAIDAALDRKRSELA